MTKENEESNQKLKFYHFIILGCLLSSLLIFNSNYVNNQKAEAKLNEEKSQLFDQIMSQRYLQQKSNNSTDEICARGSEDLIEYYKTGDLKKIELNDEKIKCEDKDEDYLKALINLIKTFAGDKGKEEESSQEGNDVTSPEPGTGAGDGSADPGGRRYLEGSMNIDEMQDDLISYGKHLLPILVFFVIAILCIPGYLLCCCCCCCNCCCCCCCKKPGCKVPCFIFTYILYALVVAVCFYGLTQSNSIYAGLADTECSFLKFFDQILDGETKQDLPRWAGISGIDDILEDLHTQINSMKSGTRNDMNTKIGEVNTTRDNFATYMQGCGNKFFDGSGNYLDAYSATYNFNLGGKTYDDVYVLDIVRMFGKYDATDKKYLPENSCLDIWEKEYSLVAETADSYMAQANEGFQTILDNKVDDLLKSLNDGRNQLNEIKSSFESIKNDISSMLIDYSGLIDEYGKLGFKAVFGVLALMNIAIAALILLICLCSGKSCTNCCCCRCICKLFTHLLWNILAILMIIVFLFGAIVALIGQVGSDAMSIISFIVSTDNTENILLDQLGKSKSYLDRCINGDGQIAEELGIDANKIKSFDDIKTAEQQIEDTKKQFEENKQFVTYNIYLNKLLTRVDLTDYDLILMPHDATFDPNNLQSLVNSLNFSYILTSMNEAIQFDTDTHNPHNEKWGKDGDTSLTCDDPASHTEEYIFHPQYCKPSERGWISDITNNDIKNMARIISDTITFIDNAKEVASPSNYNYFKVLNDLKGQYEIYLNKYIETLEFFNSTIKKITGKLNEYSSEDQTFSFVQCNFVGTNLKIILKYLKIALGKDIYTVGICFLIVGCSLILSISSTILLIVVINTDIDKNKKDLKKAEGLSHYVQNSEGRVIRYAQY